MFIVRPLTFKMLQQRFATSTIVPKPQIKEDPCQGINGHLVISNYYHDKNYPTVSVDHPLSYASSYILGDLQKQQQAYEAQLAMLFKMERDGTFD